MKNLKYLLVMLIFVSINVMAEDIPAPTSKPDAELTRKEAELRINEFQKIVKGLEDKMNELNGKYDGLKVKLSSTNQAIKDCNDELRRLIGASDADVAAFAQRVGVLEGKVREMQRLSNDALADRQEDVKKLEAELNDLRSNKISVLPQFYQRLVDLGKDIKGLYREKKISTYTVGTWAEDKDCLWNIAGKIEIYGDPFMWPKIWQGNKDQIRNPDIIFPGQILQLPLKGPKSNDEMKAERKYWRNKKAAEASETPATPGTKAGTEAGKKSE